MSGMRPSWGKIGIFIFFFAVSAFIFSVQARAVSENAQEGALQAGGHAGVAEGVQPGGHEGGQAEGEGHGGDRSGDLRDLIFRIINFVLMVIILIWALKKADIKGLFSKRIEDIRQKLETLKQEKDEAEKNFHDIETKLKMFEKERIEILEQYKKEGEAEKEKIIAEADLRVQQIIEQRRGRTLRRHPRGAPWTHLR